MDFEDDAVFVEERSLPPSPVSPPSGEIWICPKPLGGLTSATGVGATIGVPAMAVSTTLVIGGFTNAGIGFRETMNSLMSSEDSGAGAGSGAGPPAAR